MSDNNERANGPKVSYREFDRAMDDLGEKLDQTEKFFLDNISNVRVSLGNEIVNVEKRTADKIDLARLTSDKSIAAMEVRIAGLNEWRAQLADERSTFTTKKDNEYLKSEIELTIQPLKDELARLSKLSYQQQGIQKQSDTNWTKWGIVILALGQVVTVIIAVAGLLHL